MAEATEGVLQEGLLDVEIVVSVDTFIMIFFLTFIKKKKLYFG